VNILSEYLEITGQEKKQVVRSQLKNIQLNKYGVELHLLQENAIPETSEILINSYNSELELYELKEQVLINKLEELELQYPEMIEGE
jgi:hypothetical protein